jgi:hypothetical protein
MDKNSLSRFCEAASSATGRILSHRLGSPDGPRPHRVRRAGAGPAGKEGPDTRAPEPRGGRKNALAVFVMEGLDGSRREAFIAGSIPKTRPTPGESEPEGEDRRAEIKPEPVHQGGAASERRSDALEWPSAPRLREGTGEGSRASGASAFLNPISRVRSVTEMVTIAITRFRRRERYGAHRHQGGSVALVICWGAFPRTPG